jgi:prephenate dehydrogenase
MSADFPIVTILGGGLLGGSLALALGHVKNPPQVRLWARRPETVAQAREIGIEGATDDLAAAVNEADLIILAVPVGSMPELLSSAMEAGLKTGCLVTDVGSVKRAPHESLAPLLEDTGACFIGSHPMAGSERNGLAAVTSSLFENAACLLTNDHGAAPEACAALERFWQAVGCRTSWMTAAVHDELVARISHVPHLVAAAAARVCLRDPSEGRFGGGGLRDTTRVASGNATMWAEIVTENREAIAAPLREMIEELSGIVAALDHGDQEVARQWLADAKHRRDLLNPPC